MEINWGHQGNYEGSTQELTNCTKDPNEEAVTNPMWDILLVTKEEVKQVAKSILTTKAVHLQTEYMGRDVHWSQ